MLLDAVTLEQSYADMLAKLAADGTKVVRYGRDSHAALVRAFRSIGLKILGPSETQLLVCAKAIADRTRDALDAVSAPRRRAERRRSVSGRCSNRRSTASTPSDRPGPPINLQSVVTRFKVGDVKLLFAGDMQFADPQVGDPRLRSELDKLRAAIRARGAVRARQALASRQPERLQPRRPRCDAAARHLRRRGEQGPSAPRRAEGAARARRTA